MGSGKYKHLCGRGCLDLEARCFCLPLFCRKHRFMVAASEAGILGSARLPPQLCQAMEEIEAQVSAQPLTVRQGIPSVYTSPLIAKNSMRRVPSSHGVQTRRFVGYSSHHWCNPKFLLHKGSGVDGS